MYLVQRDSKSYNVFNDLMFVKTQCVQVFFYKTMGWAQIFVPGAR